METRPAEVEDAAEVVRLAAMMFESMGMDTSDPAWHEEGRRHVHERLGQDLAVFVVDHPLAPGRLVASAAGTVARRLPTPMNPSALAGYIQWVCTEPDFRGRGLARRVMAALMSWYEAHGVPTVELHATAQADALYRSLGFDDSGPVALRRRMTALP